MRALDQSDGTTWDDMITSNGGDFHKTACSSHLLASKVLFEERKFISNIM